MILLEGKILYEEEFLDGVPEITNDAYAYAKRGLLVHLDAIKEKNHMKYALYNLFIIEKAREIDL